MPGPTVDVQQEGDDVAVVALSGEHDIATAPAIRAAIAEAFEGSRALVLDLSPATFVDSTVLGVLVAARDQARTAGRGYAVLLDGEGAVGVRRILDVTGLAGLLPVSDSRTAALDAARAA